MQATADAPFADLFPRLYELKAATPDSSHPDAYFRCFETNLQSEHVRFVYMQFERPLQSLDADAWSVLKQRVTPLLSARSASRGWQKLFDALNEARGYAYLRNLGCNEVAFIKPTKRRTPDLSARQGGARVLCEVKTINISKEEANRRYATSLGHLRAFSVPIHAAEGMLSKVSHTLADAIQQLDSEDPSRTARRIVFTVIDFDDSVGDYQPEYFADIDAHLLANPIQSAELVFHPARNLFRRQFIMRAATVVEV
jgi:hypothetical protein